MTSQDSGKGSKGSHMTLLLSLCRWFELHVSNTIAFWITLCAVDEERTFKSEVHLHDIKNQIPASQKKTLNPRYNDELVFAFGV